MLRGERDTPAGSSNIYSFASRACFMMTTHTTQQLALVELFLFLPPERQREDEGRHGGFRGVLVVAGFTQEIEWPSSSLVRMILNERRDSLLYIYTCALSPTVVCECENVIVVPASYRHVDRYEEAATMTSGSTRTAQHSKSRIFQRFTSTFLFVPHYNALPLRRIHQKQSPYENTR